MKIIELLTKELGVEIGEEFKFDERIYKFEKSYLYEGNLAINLNGWLVDLMLKRKDEIVKIPTKWEPKTDEKYFRVGIKIRGDMVVSHTVEADYYNTHYDKLFIITGNCFKTYKEAEQFGRVKAIKIKEILDAKEEQSETM